jgi:hypothetical protein
MTSPRSAKERAEAGIASSAAHAGKEWQDQAVAAARLFLRWNTRRNADDWFTIEDCRLWCSSRIDSPPDLRSWGAVTRRLKTEGIISPCGFFSAANSSNGSPKPLYRRK